MTTPNELRELLEVKTAVIRDLAQGVREVWITGKQGSWNTSQSIAHVHQVSGVLVLCNPLNRKPIAVVANEEQLREWVQQKTGVRP